MRQAIVTMYMGPTKYRGSRVKASAQAGSVTLSWNNEFNVDENHERAALLLCERFGWKGRLVGGGLPKGDGNVYVFDDEGPNQGDRQASAPMTAKHAK